MPKAKQAPRPGRGRAPTCGRNFENQARIPVIRQLPQEMESFVTAASSSSLLQSMEEDGILDWPLEVPLGKQLDKLQDDLLCPICQSLYVNPHMLKCGHSFCSLCIRKHCDATYNRTNHEVCPCCREKADLIDLRKNVSLASVIDKYRDFSQDLLTLLTNKPPAKIEVQENGVKIKKKVRMVTSGT